MNSINTILRLQVLPYLKHLTLMLCFPFWGLRYPSRRRRFLQFFRTGWHAVPVISLNDLVPASLDENETLQVKALGPKQHNCSVMELLVIACVAKSVGAKKAYEIGTYDGRSTLALACNLQDGGHVYTLNLPEDFLEQEKADPSSKDHQLSRKVRSGERFLSMPEKSVITQCWGNSLEYDAGEHAPYDLIFIDGGHDYEVVRHDTGEALRLIDRRNGAILWHDATKFGVGQYLAELVRQGHPIYRIDGTQVAVMRFKSGEPVTFEYAF